MVILINYGKKPFKVEYKAGNKTFVKTFPTHAVVAMKQLKVHEQISNRNFLAKHGVTIYDYERGTYFANHGLIPTNNALPYVFIGNNVKVSDITYHSSFDTYSGTTTQSGMTFTQSAAAAPTVYGITTSANTVMANGTISATTIGNNTYVSFSGASTSTQDVYGALTASTFVNFGINITGQSAGTKINTGATITFFISATTLQSTSVYTALQALV